MRGLSYRLLGIAKPLLERFAAVGFIQSAVILAAQTFMALFPLLIGVVALAPAGVGQTIADTVRRRLGLGGDTGAQVQRLVATRDQLHSSITFFGLLLVLASATSFTRALQRVYENAWQLPKGGLRGSIRGLVWLVGLVLYFVLLGLALSLTTSHAFGVSALRTMLVIAGAVLLWWLSPFLLLCGRVRLRSVVVTGALTATVLLIAGAASTVIMPRMMASNESQFGAIGAIFAIQSWLVVMASLIVGAAILGALAAQSDGWIGALARGSRDPDGWRRERRPLRASRPVGTPAGAAPAPAP